MHIQRFDAIVIGAGIVGATLAASLAQQGHHIAIVEPYPSQAFDPNSAFELRVSAISRASQRALAQVGAWDKVLAKRAHAYDVMQVWDATGQGEIRFAAAELGEADLGHIVENQVTQLSLMEVLQAEPNAQLFCPASMTHLTLMPEGLRQVQLDTGVCLQAPLVVGADGANSMVRDLAGVSVERCDYGQKGLVAVVKTEHGHQDTAWQRFLPTGPLAFLPLDQGYSSIVWSLPSDQADRYLKQSEEVFQQSLASALDYRLGAIMEVGPRAAFPLLGSQASSHIAKGVALVGDAAHTIHPLAGQGVNLGIKDAVVLAELLSRCPPKLWGSHKRLRQYERARKGDNLMTMKVMEGFKLLFGHDAEVVKLARNTGLNVFNAMPVVKQQIMRNAMGL